MTTSTQSYNYQNLPNYAHLYTDNAITDTASWISVSGSFQADEAYTQLYLGVFFEDDSLAVVDNDTVPNSFSYFFLDEIYIGNDKLASINKPTQSIGTAPNPVVDQFTLEMPGAEQWSIDPNFSWYLPRHPSTKSSG